MREGGNLYFFFRPDPTTPTKKEQKDVLAMCAEKFFCLFRHHHHNFHRRQHHDIHHLPPPSSNHHHHPHHHHHHHHRLIFLHHQVGSYRVIVSFETPLLEAFSLCILQQHNCFNCDAKIIDKPEVKVCGVYSTCVYCFRGMLHACIAYEEV